MARGAHPRARRDALGISLVEVLVALPIFALVTLLAGSGIVQALRVQNLNEGAASVQGKLRRITEVVGQDLRSSLLGALTNAPYESSSTQISFTLADGGQGYQVRPQGSSTSFFGSAEMRLLAQAASADELDLVGRRALLVNGAGDASSLLITGVTAVGTSGNTWSVVHDGCPNGVSFIEPMRMFVASALGYSFDADSSDLLRTVDGAAPQVLAFGLSEFQIDYVYRHPDGALEVRPDPYTNAAGLPLRMAGGDGTVVLEALRVGVSAAASIGAGRTVERSYVSQVAMPATGSVNLRSVVTCP